VVGTDAARDLRSRARGLSHRLLPGIEQVAAQVGPYAERWAELNSQALAGSGPLWVALGDSMSQGIGAATFEGGWVPQAARLLAVAGRPYRLLNLSRSGATSEDLVDRQLPLLLGLARRDGEGGPVPPSLVTVLAGANDMMRRTTRRELPTRFRRLLDGLPPRTIVAYLPQPVRTAHRVNLVIDAARDRGITALDVRPAAKRWRGSRAPDLFHPNERGYARVAALFADAALALDYP
jgi:lysophospholipase L1-like esterase